MSRTLQFILLFSFLFTSALVGQLTVVDGQDFEVIGQSNEFQITGYVEVKMGSDQAGDFFWELILDEEVPEEWVYSICDNNTCYLGGTYLCPPDKPNTIEADSTLKFSIYLNPNGVAGGWHDTKLKLFSVADATVTFVDPNVSWMVDFATSVDDKQDYNDFTLYPNPTSDYFNISNDENIAQVSVYTILGKEMFTFKHEIGQAYSVADLDAGFYLARLIDNEGKSLKVIRFNKNSKN